MVNKAEYCEKFFEIRFSDKISKNAYLKACKWLAVKVYGRQELARYVAVQILKEEGGKLPAFKVILYVMADEKEARDDYCGKCKSLHTIMYAIDKPDCGKCKMEGYRKALHRSVESLACFWKEAFESDEEI